MKRCMECGAAVPAGEYFCSDEHYDTWMDGRNVVPGHSILDVEIGNIRRDGKGGKRKQWMPPSKPAPESSIDLNELPF